MSALSRGNGGAKAWVLCFAMLLVAVSTTARVWNIGSLGFYGDEETTALAAKALSEGRGASMPSGMPYHRALPVTALNAIASEVLGSESETVYRLSAAVGGSLTCLILWLLCGGPMGRSAALLTGLLIATSEWHILTSREARMYALFLLTFVSAAFGSWWWIRSDSAWALICTAALSLASVALHSLGVFCAIFPWCWYLARGHVLTSVWKMVGFSIAVILSFVLYDQWWVVAAYGKWREETGGVFVDIPGAESTIVPVGLTEFGIAELALGLAGAAMTVLLARRVIALESTSGGISSLVFYASMSLAGFALGLAWLHAALICIAVALILYRGGAIDIVRGEWKLVAGLCGVAVLGILLKLGATPSTMTARELLRIPYPYVTYFAEYSPGIFLFFAGGVSWLSLARQRDTDAGFRAAALVTLAILAALGMVSQWGGMRYLIGAYPFFLIVATYPMIRLAQYAERRAVGRGAWVTVLWAMLIVGGIFGGHGLPQAYAAATLEYGEKTSELVFGYPVYPDHKNPGQFVQSRLGDGDIVVAEDMLQQHWYVGRVDYWLRKPEVAAPFLYQNRHGEILDIYVNSRLLTNATLRDLSSTREKIWVITSGETHHKRDFYLSPAQQAWLKQLADAELRVFTGRDGITEVFCLNCQTNEP